MKSWLPKLSIVLGLALIWGAMGGPVFGQTADGCPAGANCIAYSTFDSELDGWSTDSVTASWLGDKSLGLQSASGLLRISDINPDFAGRDSLLQPGVYKTFYLQPGRYQVRVRAGQDATIILNDISIEVQGTVHTINTFSTLSAWYYSEITSNIIDISQPQTIRIQVGTSAPSYIDWIYLELLPDAYPTATPFAGPTITPGGPTSTPSMTPIPYSAQATPAAPAAAVCQSGTPVPVSDIPSYSATPVSGVIGMLETFQQYSVDLSSRWSRSGNVVPSGSDHTGDGGVSIKIQYDPHWATTTASGFDQALILETNFGVATWVNAYAQADVVLAGGSAKMEIWELVGSTWSRVGSDSIGAQYWYPIHAAISASATHIAFVPARSDTPSAGWTYLDDVYIYSPEANQPYCSGGYPTGTMAINGGDISNGNGSTTIMYPVGKECPTSIMQPNNIWGMLLAQATLFLDGQMAWAPSHVLGATRDLAQQFMLGPLGGIIQIGTIILDWSVPITMLKIYIAFQAGLAVIGIWKTIRRAFIV